MTVLVVTGTGTGVGKTVVTAALACHARQAGIDVAVCKPVQTGTDTGDDDLAVELGAPALVVVAAELGTLNHTALTLEALVAQGVPCAGLVIGSWPRRPGLVETSNRSALARLAPVRAALTAGAASLDPADFAAMSAAAFDRDWVTTLIR